MVSLVHMTGSEGPISLAVVPERTTLLFELRLRWDKVNLNVSDRSHRCMLNTIDGPSESVEDYLCDPEEMPLGARESRLPCPEDCVLNDWGPWGRCSLVRAHITHSSHGRVTELCSAPRDPSWYLRPDRNISSLWRLSRARLYEGSSVWISVNRLFLARRRRNKRDLWTGREAGGKRQIYHLRLLCCAHCALSKERQWFMLKPPRFPHKVGF